MVGTSTIGDNKLRPESLPPEARTLNRLFRLLHDPQVIRLAILEVLDRAPACEQIPQIRQLFEISFHRLKDFEHRRDRMFEQKLAKALNAAIENAFADVEDDMDSLMGSPEVKKSPAAPANGSDSEESVDSMIEAAERARKRNSKPGSTSGRRSSRGSKKTPTPSSATKEQDQASIALVSEADQGVAVTTEEDDDASQSPTNAKDFWGMLLEAMQLQVAAQTTRVWGRKKIYEIYRLNGPATTTKSAEEVRLAIHDEFGSILGGEYRTYALQRPSDGHFCIFLKIGKYYDYQDERNRAVSGEKKKKQANEFMVTVKPGSTLMAVTASRAPSRAKHIKYLLPALDLGLATVDKNVARSVVYEPPARVGDYTGTEPMDLLHAAQAAEMGSVTGRFATFASNDTNQDPLTEMHQVATGSVVSRTKEQNRLATSAAHGRSVAQAAARAPSGTAVTVVTGGGTVLDHAAADKLLYKRSRGIHFGEGGPRFKKVKFEWSGTTKAVTKSWDAKGAPKMKFKCALTVSGANVYEGLREMLVLGICHTPLPDFIRDAPNLGTSTIKVRDGAVVAAEDSFA